MIAGDCGEVTLNAAAGCAAWKRLRADCCSSVIQHTPAHADVKREQACHGEDDQTIDKREEVTVKLVVTLMILGSILAVAILGGRVERLDVIVPDLEFLDVESLTVDYLLVNSYYTDEVLRFDCRTGEYMGVFAAAAELDGPNGIALGPDGLLYVSSYDNASVLRFDGESGRFVDVFIDRGVGGLETPQELAFGPSGDLYVVLGDPAVLRYDGKTGEYLGEFATTDLVEPDCLVFGSDGLLYVGDLGTNDIKRYDANTGEFVDVFISSDELNGPLGIAFGPDDLVYVSSAFNNRILRYSAATGEFVDVFAAGEELDNPVDIVFDLQAGYLYVDNFNASNVLRYDLSTGQLIDIVVPSGSGGLQGAAYMLAMQY